ncbi:MAG: hypothetical protein J6A21_08305 [Lentisphaeria bacterium]|nr:hypothetical protein [Lentisphaeria bacterium]
MRVKLGKRFFAGKISALSILLATASIFCTLSGCRSSGVYVFSEKDAVTSEEKQAILAQVRRFVNRGKLHLTKAERNYVQNTDPVMKIHYTGRKRGELTVRWDFPNHRTLILKRKGHLLFEGTIHWDVRILTDYATPAVPRHFFGARGEDIRLVSPEATEVLKRWEGDPAPSGKQTP